MLCGFRGLRSRAEFASMSALPPPAASQLSFSTERRHHKFNLYDKENTMYLSCFLLLLPSQARAGYCRARARTTQESIRWQVALPGYRCTRMDPAPSRNDVTVSSCTSSWRKENKSRHHQRFMDFFGAKVAYPGVASSCGSSLFGGYTAAPSPRLARSSSLLVRA